MTKTKPPKTIEEYKNWARDFLDIDFDLEKTELIYNQNSIGIHVKAREFFNSLQEFLKESSKKYSSKNDVDLFMSGKPEYMLYIKPYTSIVEKSFRYNVVWNKRFPLEPYYPHIESNGIETVEPEFGEWLTPNNWFTKVNDIVRTRMVCKFKDGPQFLASELNKFAKISYKSKGIKNFSCISSSRQKDNGYYAYHTYIPIPVHLQNKENEFKSVKVFIEFQLTTQLQDILNDMTHKYYEQLRTQLPKDDDTWKWEFSSNRFRSGYLSHALHLLEAIILEVRESGMEK